MKFKDACLLRRKAMTNLNSVLKSRDITLPTLVCIVKTTVFPVVVYKCESWIIKKVEQQRIDVFKLVPRKRTHSYIYMYIYLLSPKLLSLLVGPAFSSCLNQCPVVAVPFIYTSFSSKKNWLLLYTIAEMQKWVVRGGREKENRNIVLEKKGSWEWQNHKHKHLCTCIWPWFTLNFLAVRRQKEILWESYFISKSRFHCW